MTLLHKIIFVLTGLLFLVGSVLFFSETSLFVGGSDSFATEAEYESARGKGELPEYAPDLPTCANDITLETDETDTAVHTLSFRCDDRLAREAYIAQIKNAFDWNIFIKDGDRIEIERVTPE